MIDITDELVHLEFIPLENEVNAKLETSCRFN